MSNYNKILQQFTKLGYNENTHLNETQVKRNLDQICRKNASLRQFQYEVAEELWFQTEKNNDNTVTLKNYIAVIIKAQNILKTNITKAEEQLASGASDQERKQQLQETLHQCHDDLNLLTIPFQITDQAESKYNRQSKINNNVQNSRASSRMQESGLFSGRNSGIFSGVPSKRQNSPWLKFSFILAVILFLLELIIMFHKNHFYNSLIYIMIFSIVLLGYFDKYYVKFVLVNLVISTLLDFVWIIVLASPYWNPNPPTHHSTIQTPFLRFMYLFVIILMIGKGLLAILFFRYRDNDESVRKSISIFGNVFEIDGRVKQTNPISRLLSGRGIFGSNLNQ